MRSARTSPRSSESKLEGEVSVKFEGELEDELEEEEEVEDQHVGDGAVGQGREEGEAESPGLPGARTPRARPRGPTTAPPLRHFLRAAAGLARTNALRGAALADAQRLLARGDLQRLLLPPPARTVKHPFPPRRRTII